MKLLTRSLVAASLLACVGGARPEAISPSSEDGLTGVWRVALRVDYSLDSAVLRTSRVEGLAALTPHAPTVSDALLSLVRPSHFGVYALALERIGIVYPRLSQGPILAAREDAADSVSVVLQPELSHGAIMLRGIRIGDSISGRWILTGYVSPMSGSFTMRRVTEF